MAAVFPNADNGPICNDHSYSHSSGLEKLSTTDSLLDSLKTSPKTAGFDLRQKVNGLSHLEESSRPLQEGDPTNNPGTAKSDSSIQMLVNSKTTDQAEKSDPEKLFPPIVKNCQTNFNQLETSKSPLFNLGSTPNVQDEKSIKCQESTDSKSINSLSIENTERKLSLCDTDMTKKAEVSSQHSYTNLKKESQENSQLLDCVSAEPKSSSSQNSDNEQKPGTSETEKLTHITSILEDKCLPSSNFNDNKLCDSVTIPAVNNSAKEVGLPENKAISQESETWSSNTNLKKDSAIVVPCGKPPEESDPPPPKNLSSVPFPDYPSMSKADDKPGSVSNIPELLAHCSPCRVVIQDFFKELNIDLLELSRNFPVHNKTRKRRKYEKSKSVQNGAGEISVKEQIKNNLVDSWDQTKQAKCYTENSKRRKKQCLIFEENDLNEDPEENLPLLAVCYNLSQNGNNNNNNNNAAAGILGKRSNSNDNKTISDKENLKTMQMKGDNPDALATEERMVTKSSSSVAVSLSTPKTNADASNSVPKMSVINISPPSVNLNDSNDLGLKIVSVSSQGSVFFPAFASDTNNDSKKMDAVLSHPTSKNLNGQHNEKMSCEDGADNISPPKCKFHGANSSPVRNLYKCKKCSLEVKSLSEIQAHMAGSHSEFSMYRCPFCTPPRPVKRVSVYSNRPIEFEVLRDSTCKLMAASSTSMKKASSTAMSSKRKTPRHIQVQREKKRKLNYYYQNQREIKMYKNEKVNCQYCHKQINQSNISRHQNSKICSNPKKKNLGRSLMMGGDAKKYQKVKCHECRKYISRTNLSKHSRICPKENHN